MKIAMVTSEYPPYADDKSGLGSHSRSLARALVNEGCEVIVISYVDDLGGEREDYGVRILLVGGLSVQKDASEYGATMQSINRQVAHKAVSYLTSKEFHPDIVHVQGSYGIYTGEILATSFGCPLVGTIHLLHESLFSVVKIPPPRYLVEFDRRLCESVDVLIAVSEFLEQEVRDLFLRPNKPIRVVQNGTCPPLSIGSEIESFREGGENRIEKDIVFVGRLVPQKGVLQLLQSASIVIEEFPQVRYLLIGARYDEGFCKQLDDYLADKPTLHAAVTFLGPMGQEDVWRVCRNSFMFVTPSLYESFGLAVVEAMHCGVPVVASAVGGLKEVVVHESSGLLLEPIVTDGGVTLDPNDLARLQLQLLRSPEWARQMGENGATRARREFSEEVMAKRTLACYEFALLRTAAQTDYDTANTKDRKSS